MNDKKVLLSMPSALHAELAQQAAAKHIPVSTYMRSILADAARGRFTPEPVEDTDGVDWDVEAVDD